jgi:hypothetical protein
MRLNGWQRLWIVLSVLWLMVVLGVGYVRWPLTPAAFTRSEDRHYSVKDSGTGKTLDFRGPQPPTLAQFQNIFVTEGIVPSDTAYEIVQIPGLGETEFPFMTFKSEVRTMSDAEVTAAAAKLSREYVRTVHRQQMTFTGEAFAAWVLPVAVLYLLGWAIAWVRRGFTTAEGMLPSWERPD